MNNKDFTETEYRELIKSAKAHWKFIRYAEFERKKPSILWRHDIDFSIQRAYALAQIEAEEGVQSTYFILLHGTCYNPLEKVASDIILKIKELGHDLGLHFDPTFYADTIKSKSDLEEAMVFEKYILERLFHTNIRVFSWHNPTVCGDITIDDAEIAGMINAYGTAISCKYSYVSDSNGIWRYRRLGDVLTSHTDTHLQVLTHPEWWTPEPMPPRDRIIRSIDGRARAALKEYDSFLKLHDRPNVGLATDTDLGSTL